MKVILTKIITFVIILTVIIPSQASATNNEAETPIAFVPEALATLYVTKKNGNLENFTLNINGHIQHFPLWRNVDSEAHKPRMLYNDINKDGQKELIIILTIANGTNRIIQDAHVFHKVRVNFVDTFQEILIDDPLAIFLKHAKTSLTPTKATITVGNKTKIIHLMKFGIPSEQLFSDIGIGSIVKFDVVHHELVATLGLQASSSSSIGSVTITYLFKDKMYQIKKISLEA
ncbi:hypothetical protein [Priestia taiwanensis]|uniref:FG-GAP repeat protein n=1 Tax=Priestia taiwanensis TaxID=1347902 RepID=A0A917AP23_9BACI|nr:hypothetical protein [Priestia taiwanensis]MBM7362599.1 hypothetical protein [Priestia taiwanensis]GGE63563.1 hypothetical protein GCM10007140_12240 [Priestia taiwanensis]